MKQLFTILLVVFCFSAFSQPATLKEFQKQRLMKPADFAALYISKGYTLNKQYDFPSLKKYDTDEIVSLMDPADLAYITSYQKAIDALKLQTSAYTFLGRVLGKNGLDQTVLYELYCIGNEGLIVTTGVIASFEFLSTDHWFFQEKLRLINNQ